MEKEQPKEAVKPKSQSGLEPNVAAALSYVLGAISGIIFLLIEKEDKFVRFHAWQSVALSVVLMIASAVSRIIPVFGWILNSLWGLAAFILWIVLMYKAYSKEEFQLPVVGGFAKNQVK